jgi:hypothetical protein
MIELNPAQQLIYAIDLADKLSKDLEGSNKWFDLLWLFKRLNITKGTIH